MSKNIDRLHASSVRAMPPPQFCRDEPCGHISREKAFRACRMLREDIIRLLDERRNKDGPLVLRFPITEALRFPRDGVDSYSQMAREVKQSLSRSGVQERGIRFQDGHIEWLLASSRDQVLTFFTRLTDALPASVVALFVLDFIDPPAIVTEDTSIA